MSIVDIARPDIRALTPYSSARMEARGGTVMLNANEAPLGEWNRYPEPQPEPLLQALARLYGVATEQVLVGRGSDEAIDLLVRAFCRAGHDAVLICPPTFGMYAVCARIQDARVGTVPLGADFMLDVEAVLAAVVPATKIVFLCSPNNPTGDLVPLASIERIAAQLAGRALVVVDEAYLEFADAPSASVLIARYDNIAVLRTLSKAHALAGARIGALIASAQVIELTRRIQAPYPLPEPCVQAALAALQADALRETQARIALTRRERERLASSLRTLPHVRAILPSHANFLCVRFADAAATYAALLRAGVVVRDVGYQPGLDRCLRITIGTPQENATLLAALGACEAAA